MTNSSFIVALLPSPTNTEKLTNEIVEGWYAASPGFVSLHKMKFPNMFTLTFDCTNNAKIASSAEPCGMVDLPNGNKAARIVRHFAIGPNSYATP